VEEQFYDRRPVVALPRFEFVDFVVGPAPFGFGGEPFHPLDQHAAVPAAVEHRDLARGGEPAPEAPEIMMRAFGLRRRGDRVDRERARVPLRRQPLDRTALARRVPAFEDDDGAAAMDDVRDLNAGKAILDGGERVGTIAVEGRSGFVI